MPQGRWGEDNSPLGAAFDLKSRVVAGAVAGNIVVTGILPGAKLLTVINLAAAGANLVGEFTITAADTINNVGGTNTTGMVLLVQWLPAEKAKTGY